MPEGIRPRLYSIPLGTSLTDVLADFLLKQAGVAREALADTLVLLPNNRAIKSMTDSFVRRADKGLLLPRMVAVGDLSLDESLAPLLDPIGAGAESPVPRAIGDIHRRILLSRLIRQQRPVITPVEAMRLAKQLASTLDQLDVEQVSLSEVKALNPLGELSIHWESGYGDFIAIADAYRSELKRLGLVNPAERRNIMLARFANALPSTPQDRHIVAAGITTSAPAIADLLKAVSRFPNAILVWPHVDLQMPASEWEALGPIVSDEGTLPLSEETHPQFHLKLLFDRMGVRRDEIEPFPKTSQISTATTINHIFCRAEATLSWANLKPSAKSLTNVRLLNASDSAEEALSIGILIREALEQPEKRIALVTPDRELAVRVAAQLRRWDVHVDDSAGQPLAQLPPATLLLSLAALYADRIAPVSLLSVLKHPLIKIDQPEDRLKWLEMVRRLDLALRGPRTGTGLSAIGKTIIDDQSLADWWAEISGLFSGFDSKAAEQLPSILDVLAHAATGLTDGKVWQGQAGRQLAQLLEEYRANDLSALGVLDRGSVPVMLAQMLDSEVIRPVYGSHPRVAIFGLLEARLQQADLVVCGALNEGSWPQLPQSDPWLAPRLRRELQLPGPDRNIGLSAHDLASLLGASEVILTRAQRDRSAPTVASRFVLRMQALLGKQLQEETRALTLARSIDLAPVVPPPERPAPRPSKEQRRVTVSVTQVELLKADPFSFYARHILRLTPLETVGSEPNAAWRGTVVHDVLEHWAKQDNLDPVKLRNRAEALTSNPAFHPALRVLWQPRITAGLDWIAEETIAQRDHGRTVLAAEKEGKLQLAGITLKGRADRIDKAADGRLVIVDYKTGKAPSAKSVKAGFSLQLGLIGAMAESGVIEGVNGTVAGFEYWSLAKRKDGGFGAIRQPVAAKSRDKVIQPEDFVAFAVKEATEAIELRIIGDEPFTAKLHPEYAPYGDYDQLMRHYEWYGRETEDVG